MPHDNNFNKGISSFNRQKKSPIMSCKSYLFAIGINEYQSHPHLYNAVEDAKALVEVLTRRYNFLPENVTELYNHQATADNILEKLAYFQKLTQNDNLLIFFSGHGYYKNKVGYLVPHDAKTAPAVRFINNSTLFDELSQINARHILLIADSCFSGSLFKDVANPVQAVAEKVEGIPSRYALSAGNIELVSDGLVGNHSPFTRELLKVLRANEQAKLPVSHLFHDVRNMVTYAQQQPLGGPIHRLNERLGGEFVFNLQEDETQDWNSTLAINTHAAFEGFLKKYPTGQFTNKAMQRLTAFEKADRQHMHDEAYRRAKQSPALPLLVDFLEKYPDSPFKAEIRSLLKDVETEEAWNRVPKNSIAALDEYLEENQFGKYATEARLRIEKIKTDRRQEDEARRQSEVEEVRKQQKEAVLKQKEETHSQRLRIEESKKLEEAKRPLPVTNSEDSFIAILLLVAAAGVVVIFVWQLVVGDAPEITLVLLVGAVAGWLAGLLFKGFGFGLIGNIVVGILGGFIGYWLLPKVGVSLGTGTLGYILTAVVGAIGLLAVIGLVRRV